MFNKFIEKFKETVDQVISANDNEDKLAPLELSEKSIENYYFFGDLAEVQFQWYRATYSCHHHFNALIKRDYLNFEVEKDLLNTLKTSYADIKGESPLYDALHFTWDIGEYFKSHPVEYIIEWLESFHNQRLDILYSIDKTLAIKWESYERPHLLEALDYLKELSQNTSEFNSARLRVIKMIQNFFKKHGPGNIFTERMKGALTAFIGTTDISSAKRVFIDDPKNTLKEHRLFLFEIMKILEITEDLFMKEIIHSHFLGLSILATLLDIEKEFYSLLNEKEKKAMWEYYNRYYLQEEKRILELMSNNFDEDTNWHSIITDMWDTIIDKEIWIQFSEIYSE